MKCIFCGSENLKVVDKRDTDVAIRRRRECISCNKRFTTYEKVETAPLMVIKKSGDRSMFSREKVLHGIIKSCEKRPISVDEIQKVVDKIEGKVRSKFEHEVPSKKIGEEIMKELKKLDKIAYIRFASVYREFQDLEDFSEMIKKLNK